MTITTDVNEAKDDIDQIIGEAQRLTILFEIVKRWLPSQYDADQMGEAIDIIRMKARKVRASL